jgi:hypothetical protein
LLTLAGDTLIDASADLILVIVVGLAALPFAAAGIRTLWRRLFSNDGPCRR